jgi:hypothetical protein
LIPPAKLKDRFGVEYQTTPDPFSDRIERRIFTLRTCQRGLIDADQDRRFGGVE